MTCAADQSVAQRASVRNAELADVGAIRAVCRAAYPDIHIYSTEQLRTQIQSYPEGQFVAVLDGRIVGYCACFRVAETAAFSAHSWFAITGSGTASRHNPQGDWLYGMEVCVDPALRGRKIGRRLYEARKALCRKLGLEGIAIAGRLSELAHRWDEFGSANAYVEQIMRGDARDPALSFQIANGFTIVGVMSNYLPLDLPAKGYAALMYWRNSKTNPAVAG